MDIEHEADAMIDNIICQASFGSIPDEFDFAREARRVAIRAPAIIFYRKCQATMRLFFWPCAMAMVSTLRARTSFSAA